MPNRTVEAVANMHCDTGENPYWNPQDGCIWWVDIPLGRVFCHDESTGQTKTVYEGEPVGGFTLQEDGNWLIFRVNDVAVMTPAGEVKPVIEFQDEGAKRFNDVFADATGQVFAGTIGASRESGGLYRVGRDGSIVKLFAGTGCANGMAFTPDGRTMLWTDSTNKRIDAFAYDPATGELTERRTWYTATPDEGTPDGCAMDETGHLWSTRWGGGCIMRHGPDGKVVEKIEMPVSRVSSCYFGGPDRRMLYITTAGGKGHDTGTPDGTLYRMPVDVAGRPEFRSRVLL
ncbi:MAG: SMP-30/gluconolactonase/LRE family protein [Phycisphaerae bacterium]